MSNRVAILAVAALLLGSSASDADDNGHQKCSLKKVAGYWAFATDVGRQMLGPGGDITALGTMTLNRDGDVNGIFDFTIEDAISLTDVTFTGTLEVNADCRGTLEFVTSTGSVRTDSIVVINRREMLGMSRDPANLWTYSVRRLGK